MGETAEKVNRAGHPCNWECPRQRDTRSLGMHQDRAQGELHWGWRRMQHWGGGQLGAVMGEGGAPG